MAIEPSILKNVKKNLGLDENYNAFDSDVITHINSAFFTLHQLGVGPEDGFVVEEDTDEWDDFSQGRISQVTLGAIRTFVYLHVRMLFDPPGTPHHLTAMTEQKNELIHRIKMQRELEV